MILFQVESYFSIFKFNIHNLYMLFIKKYFSSPFPYIENNRDLREILRKNNDLGINERIKKKANKNYSLKLYL